jgi:putative ABC transport system permease protein
MIKNYLLVSFRNLRKHFSYSLINIFGLGIGLATCLLLVTWIRHELSYDKFHAKADRIYRSSLEMDNGGEIVKMAVSPTALLPTLRELPEVEAGTLVYNPTAWNPYIVKKDDRIFQENKFYFADSTFFDVFSYEVLQGDPESALDEPNSVMLTEATAKKYFGSEDPVGKTLTINGDREFTVTGVMRNIPSNSFLQFDFLGSWNSMPKSKTRTWWEANYQTFIVVHPATDLQAIMSKTDQVVRKEIATADNSGDYVHYSLIRLTDIHLRSVAKNEPEVVGDITYVYIFSAIALLILLIACINYVNLATARAVDRAKEVGVRKVVGAMRPQLFGQFLGESVIITFVSFCLGFFIAQVLLPLFNNVTGKELGSATFYDPSFLGIAFLILVVIAMLSGAYPALAITSFKPVSVLKGNFKFSGKGIWLRKFLVVTQFSISIVLIVSTIVILRQLNFIQDKKLGYSKENVLVLPMDPKTRQSFTELQAELMRSGEVEAVGRGTESPTRIQGGYGFTPQGKTDGESMLLTAVAIDTGFVSALGMELLAGRNFTSADFERVKTDTFYSFIVNEALLKSLYVEPEKALGMRARLSGRQGEIVGVVNDFHYSTLHSPIGPLVMFSQVDYHQMFLKLKEGNMNDRIQNIRQVCSNVLPHRPFEYRFLDEEYDKLYSSEQRLGMVFTIFATLAIVIACLGLLGLVAFSAAQKTKEIGIRKVLGATATNIVLLITSDFTKLVLVAIVLGIPASYWIMGMWLEDFAYRVDIGWWPILAASLICLCIAFGTAGFQAVKAALIDPAKTLRND